jgi:hypothetical protein
VSGDRRHVPVLSASRDRRQRRVLRRVWRAARSTDDCCAA